MQAVLWRTAPEVALCCGHHLQRVCRRLLSALGEAAAASLRGRGGAGEAIACGSSDEDVARRLLDACGGHGCLAEALAAVLAPESPN